MTLIIDLTPKPRSGSTAPPPMAWTRKSTPGDCSQQRRSTRMRTNVLLRLVLPHDPLLLAYNNEPPVTAQNLIAFWAVATRPNGPPANGLEMTISEAQNQLGVIRNVYRFVPNSPPVIAK